MLRAGAEFSLASHGEHRRAIYAIGSLASNAPARPCRLVNKVHTKRLNGCAKRIGIAKASLRACGGSQGNELFNRFGDIHPSDMLWLGSG